MRLLRGEALDTLSHEREVEQYGLEQWSDKALLGIELALKDRTGEPVQVELDAAKLHIGDLWMQVELLERQLDQLRPFARRKSRK